MKWLEIIIVRAAGGLDRSTLQELVAQSLPSRRPPGLGAITLLRNAFVASDVCIHLPWDRPVDEPDRSVLGLSLASVLEDSGRVHHTLWIPERPGKGRA